MYNVSSTIIRVFEIIKDYIIYGHNFFFIAYATMLDTFS